jgi:hypothetical protein
MGGEMSLTKQDQAAERLREQAEKLCEQWFDTGARASWCPKMVDEFAEALRDAERRGRMDTLKQLEWIADGIADIDDSNKPRAEAIRYAVDSLRTWAEQKRALHGEWAGPIPEPEGE